MKLEVNVGEKDRMIRLGAGGLLLVLALAQVLGVWAAIIGLALIATGYTRRCPGYQVIGKNTLEPKA